jgi:hypothetical protein
MFGTGHEAYNSITVPTTFPVPWPDNKAAKAVSLEIIFIWDKQDRKNYTLRSLITLWSSPYIITRK